DPAGVAAIADAAFATPAVTVVSAEVIAALTAWPTAPCALTLVPSVLVFAAAAGVVSVPVPSDAGEAGAVSPASEADAAMAAEAIASGAVALSAAGVVEAAAAGAAAAGLATATASAVTTAVPSCAASV